MMNKNVSDFENLYATLESKMNFEKIQEVMARYNHTWYEGGQFIQPDLDTIKETTKKLCWDAWVEGGVHRTGGFEAECSDRSWMRLSFVLDSQEGRV